MTRRPWTESEAEYEMEVRRPGIEFEMPRELGQAEEREIGRRVERALAARHCPVHDQRVPCTNCAGDHAARDHQPGTHRDTCARCAKTPPAQIEAQHLAAADDSLDSPNDQGA